MSILRIVPCILAGGWLMAADKPKLPDGPGKATVERVCGSCHAAEMAMNRRETREGWSAVIEDMIRRGTKATDEEFGEVADYLVATFPKSSPLPKVEVNKADAGELGLVLGLDDRKAAALVKHREEVGGYKTFDDLLKAPGIDVRIATARKNRLVF